MGSLPLATMQPEEGFPGPRKPSHVPSFREDKGNRTALDKICYFLYGEVFRQNLIGDQTRKIGKKQNRMF
jgi:hypothetical protein